MDRTYRYDPGCGAIACLAAGPIFLGWLSAGTFALRAKGSQIPIEDLAAAPLMLMVLPVVVVVGGILALVPVVGGAVVMTWLANRSAALAAPIAWLAAGEAIAAVAGFVIAEGVIEVPLLLAATGASCAALAHRGLRPI